MSGPTVLVVDDERNLAKAIKAFLEASGYEAEVASSAEQAVELLDRLRPDVVFTDLRLPGMSGIDLLKRVREFDAATPVVVMTAFGTIEGAVEAVKLGAFDYLKKPVDLEELKLLADRARETSQLKQELSFYRRRASQEESFGSVLGSSPAMKAVLERAREVAALAETPPVLITGETGTGKGLVARTIHTSGPRSAKPFIDVNCTALPANLMEAELFGYERGAFTDAKESKLGLFEAAEGGFIFLDEIGDLELALQGKLLRAIEERTVRRVGGIRDRKIDVRILAATNRDIEHESKGGQFRKDLYFRLAVILLRLPPLRERGDDVLALAQHYLRQFSTKYGKPARRLDSDAELQLKRYPWPGNVRELSHVIERAVLWSQGELVGVDHLSLNMPAAGPAVGGAPPAGISATAEWDVVTEGMDLAELEKSMLERALRDAAGNQTRAAQRLGISRDTLRYRLKKYGLQG
ncbi:MAG TPA: sigma-54 dependent transcriptional regulator [Gemmatimonadales bacterium]|nr:sigma-54 dependent transcriptional regulator [Gemmatimonadales bacterium]